MTHLLARNDLFHYLEGTCMTLETAVEALELDPDVDWEDEILSAGLELCLGCDWWYESGDLISYDGETIGYCGQCRDDHNDSR